MKIVTKNNNNITLEIEGSINTQTACDFETAIRNVLDNSKSLILDFTQVDYISSAGLRVLLIAYNKSEGKCDFKVVNSSDNVLEILDMTGFSELIKVEKAFRVLSVEGREVIGQGANGKVYRLDPDTIIKVYFNPNALLEINRERELARKAFVLGIPTAIPYDVVKVGDGYGSVFELLNAKSFSKLIAANPKT